MPCVGSHPRTCSKVHPFRTYGRLPQKIRCRFPSGERRYMRPSGLSLLAQRAEKCPEARTFSWRFTCWRENLTDKETKEARSCDLASFCTTHTALTGHPFLFAFPMRAEMTTARVPPMSAVTSWGHENMTDSAGFFIPMFARSGITSLTAPR